MKTLTIMATGHSLTKKQAAYVKTAVTDVMVLNESYLMAPWCDYVFASDKGWWEHYGEDVLGRCPTAEYLSVKQEYEKSPIASDFIPHPKCFRLEVKPDGRGGICREVGKLYAGGSSGHAALNAAYHLGYERIVLLGFDLGGGHWFKETFRPEHLRKNSPYEAFRICLNDALRELEELGVEVVDCTPGGILHCAQKRLEVVL